MAQGAAQEGADPFAELAMSARSSVAGAVLGQGPLLCAWKQCCLDTVLEAFNCQSSPGVQSTGAANRAPSGLSGEPWECCDIGGCGALSASRAADRRGGFGTTPPLNGQGRSSLSPDLILVECQGAQVP